MTGAANDDGIDIYIIQSPVNVELVHISRVRSGSLYALVSCAIHIADVEIRMNGVGILRAPDGKWCARSPMYKASDGVWKHALEMPQRVYDAILELVSDEMADVSDPQNINRR